MTTPRWSTTTLLSIAALAAMLGFYFGTAFLRAPQSVATADISQNPVVQTKPDLQTFPAENLNPLSTPATNQTAPEDFAGIVKNLLAQPATPDRDAALIAALEQLATHDPLGALAIARAETNPRLRDQLLAATFTGWIPAPPSPPFSKAPCKIPMPPSN
jgi:hypothetical protein